ncbi:biopolymer transport protein ExbD [Breoghania corrubedonensis]|uniref:Biopolymer transport protein ExbD n=1 Tax=Breoghania corrubedonensis TaxID=665038 RepID=A0A2T5VCX4_9HYPH|nr:biopolymer transporter ExbD [Breoghania corrubedonensis]PTW61609.1 biopolymer transport protein ExbD [Breoghania corrubedonensis]
MRMHEPMERARTDNTIALINVVFLMLIFFLFAGSVEPNDAHDVNPPDVSVERAKTDTGGALVILSDGTMTLRGKTIAPDALVATLTAGGEEERAQPLRIVADKSLPASALNGILVSAREAGRERIVLVARQAPGDAGAEATAQEGAATASAPEPGAGAGE